MGVLGFRLYFVLYLIIVIVFCLVILIFGEFLEFGSVKDGSCFFFGRRVFGVLLFFLFSRRYFKKVINEFLSVN